MAIGQTTGELEILITFDDKKSKAAFEKTQAKLLQSAEIHEQKLRQLKKTAETKREIDWKRHQDKMVQAQQKAQTKMIASHNTWSARMSKGMETVAASIKGFIIAWAGIKTIQIAKGVLDWVDDMNTFANSIGISIENLSALNYAAVNTGTTFERFQGTLNIIQQKMADALTNPAGEIAKLFNKMGIDVEAGLTDVVNGLLSTNDELSRTLLLGPRASNIFAKMATTTTSVSDAMAQAKKYGFLLTKETADNLDKLGDELVKLGLALKVTIANNISKLAPQITKFVDEIIKFIVGINWDDMMNNVKTMVDVIIKAAPIILKILNASIKLVEFYQKGGVIGIVWDQIKGLVEDSDTVSKNTDNTAKNLKKMVDTANTIGNLEMFPSHDKELPPMKQKIKIEAITPHQYNIPFSNPYVPIIESYDETLNNLSKQFNKYETDRTKKTAEQIAKEAEETANLQAEYLEIQEKRNKVVEEKAEAHRQRMKEFYLELAGMAFNTFNTIMELQNVQSQNQMMNIDRLQSKENERWENERDALLAAGKGETKYYKDAEKKHNAYLQKLEDDKLKLQAKEWERNKLGNISNIVMNTAAGMIRQYKDLPVWAAIATKILVAAQGAAQLAVVMSQKNPYKRALGGLIPDRYGYTDATPVLAQGGEYIVNRQATRDNLELLNMINSNRNIQPAGGTIIVNVDTLIGTQDYTDNILIPSLNNSIRKGYVLQT